MIMFSYYIINKSGAKVVILIFQTNLLILFNQQVL